MSLLTPLHVRGCLLIWRSRQDVRHRISVDPAGHAGARFGDLEEVVNARVAGSAAAVNDLARPQILVALLVDLKVVPTITVIPAATFRRIGFFSLLPLGGLSFPWSIDTGKLAGLSALALTACAPPPTI